jgi:hypothetical protein
MIDVATLMFSLTVMVFPLLTLVIPDFEPNLPPTYPLENVPHSLE